MYSMFIALLLLLECVQCIKEECPNFVKCCTSEVTSFCRPRLFYKTNVKIKGCCPGCVALKGENKPCEEAEECQIGLTCNSEKVCKTDRAQACEYYKRNDIKWNKNKYWNPECTNDGTYAPKQCKGEKLAGKCFCFDETGHRIFGQEDWYKAENMTCACSRLMSQLRKSRPFGSVHCNRIGNYEPLQCDVNVCWCATPKSGLPYTAAVPSAMMSSLPCDNKNRGGDQYYRRCDSERYSREKIKLLLKNHGTNQIMLTVASCNFDGSFHRVQPFKDKKRCVYVNNQPVTEALETEDANCHCAYDKYVHQLRKLSFTYDCQPNGNYAERQFWEGNTYCVDADGFPYSDRDEDC